jgi:hypothetical protein
MKVFFYTILLILLIFSSKSAFCDVPSEIAFQGILATNLGPTKDGIVKMEFTMYDKESAGNSLGWTETQDVTIKDGIFNIYLGSVNPVNPFLFDGKNIYLEVVIDGEALVPRLEIGSTAYSFTAQTALNVPDIDDIKTIVADEGYIKSAGCDTWQLLKWDGTKWTCSEDLAGAGALSAGYGIDVSNAGEINLEKETSEEIAKSACFDTEDELLLALSDNYAELNHNHDAFYVKTKVCSQWQVLKWDGENWICGDDLAGGGSLTEGYGISISGSGEISIKTETVQEIASDLPHNHDASDIISGKISEQRLTDNVSLLGQKIEEEEIEDGTILFKKIGQNTCSEGQVMKWSDSEMSWVCAADAMNEGTAYSEGTGIKITGYTLSVDEIKIKDWAKEVCYDNEAEITGIFNSICALKNHDHDDYAAKNHNHDDFYYKKEELNSGGTINSESNPVEWSRLKGVPEDFADGTDDGSQYFAGTGMVLKDGEFSVKREVVDTWYVDVNENNSISSAMIKNGEILFEDFNANNCDPGQVIKRNEYNTKWTCTDDLNSGGTVTQIETGTGLAGGPVKTSGTISLASNYVDGSAYDSRFVNADEKINWNKLQNFPAACPEGWAISALAETPTCSNLNINNAVQGIGGINYIAKFTNFSTIDSSIIYETNYNIGIGTKTPAEQLEITGNLRIPQTTVAAGMIKSGSNLFIHNYGSDNFFAAVNAGNLYMTGSSNIGLGINVLHLNIDGMANTAVGTNALYYNTHGSTNTAVGMNALYANITGSSNTASGNNALSSNIDGNSNTANGMEALFSNTTGNFNTASGMDALFSNINGGFNTAYGYSALYTNKNGDFNTASGTMSLYSNTSGKMNTADGLYSLYSNTQGNNNTAIGANSLYSNTTGNSNVAIGYQAGLTEVSSNGNTVGTKNVFIGANAGPSVSTQINNAIAIGYQAHVGASNSMALGGTGADAVNVGIGTASPSERLDVTGNAKISGNLYVTGTFVQASTLAQYPKSNMIYSIDTEYDGGNFTSITIGTDGAPVISFRDDVNNSLKVAKCLNGTCSAGYKISIVDSTGNVGAYSSIATGTDGNPVVSYFDVNKGMLKVAKCSNASCSAVNPPVPVDSSEDVGYYTSIAIGIDGFPVISYQDGSNACLKVAKCSSASCSSGALLVVVDSAGSTGEYTSIAVGVNGNPVIAYHSITGKSLRYMKCGNPSCTSGNIPNIVDTGTNAGLYASIAVGSDGLPVISHHDSVDSTHGSLRVVKCGDTSCTPGSNIITLIDSAGKAGEYSSVTVGIDGLPVISYYDGTNSDLKVAKCADPACKLFHLTVVDSPGTAGKYSSITMGTDGYPVIAYQGFIASAFLKIAKCTNPFCMTNWSRR